MLVFASPERRRRALARLVALSIPLAGCSMSAGAPGSFGATPGGAQDMGLARELIAAGRVPPPEAFVVEGMFSEHDLPVAGDACTHTLCVRATGAIAPDLEGEQAGWIQLGLSSTIDPETFQRAPITAIATVDVSGSMRWDDGEDAPGEVARTFLHELVDRLDERDAFAMVTYGSDVSTPVSTAPASDRPGLHAAIDRLHEAGSTNMEAGLERAFALARDARRASPERPVRVFLFTDVQPNVGATSPGAFQSMTEAAAAEGIGLTVLGVGTGIGQEVMLAMSHLRGGNAFTMFRAADVATLLEDSWPWMASPIAVDLSLAIKTDPAMTIARGIGFPGAPIAADEVELEVATVFLSRRRGALLVEARGVEGASLAGASARVALSYQEPSGELVDEAFDVALPARAEGETEAHVQDVTRRTVALALLVDGMQAAARAYPSDRAGAIELVRAAHARIEAAASVTGDEALATEVALAADLLALMEAGAPQGSLYGAY
ncbi:vWA domain-containing protein [Sandaracinus amylolyticus]|uniref:von Willebrand factor type A domain protein n=1 Tax=Sandaracinus amylolyticus TaxID=927083 RepID=A0A0F6VYV1_9BACT|nr:VWA domain-containing protein [Sandaracinus amylolyticus]AKF03143.1 Von Willebrand factor type A domain protein [Sandaracinus amylolyticus]